MEEQRKHLLDTFQKRLFLNYEAYCRAHEVQDDINGFITYMIDHSLIHPTTIKRYTILNEYDKLYPKNNYHKTQTVTNLAELFNISTRSVWTILKERQRYKK